jgi:hypothetical protein
MTLKPRVDRTYYRRLTQSRFSDFLQDIVDNTNGNIKYKNLESTITKLRLKSEAYTNALIAAQQGGKDRVLIKKIALQEAMYAINHFADGMDFYADGNVPFFTESNLPLQHTRVKHTGLLLPPTNIAGKPTGVSGQVVITFDILESQIKVTNNVGVEWSIDHGMTWNNGQYPSQKSRMVVNGLPSLHKVMIRLRCLGSRNRVSNWSSPIEVHVV